MTYQEFMQWAEDEKIDLETLEIYPDEYTNVPFSAGCYQDMQGNWYYYIQIDERTSLTPDGQKYPEEECFEKLKSSVMYKIQRREERRRELRERQERKASEKKEQ